MQELEQKDRGCMGVCSMVGLDVCFTVLVIHYAMYSTCLPFDLSHVTLASAASYAFCHIFRSVGGGPDPSAMLWKYEFIISFNGCTSVSTFTNLNVDRQ